MFCCTNNFYLLGGFLSDPAHFGVVLGIEITVVLGNIYINFPAWFEINRGEFLGFVVAFGAPGYVVRVAKRVDVEDIDVGWSEKKVLDKLLSNVRKGRLKDEEEEENQHTQVNMCHGSKNRIEATNQRM